MTFNFVRVCDHAEAAVKHTISAAVTIDVFIVGHDMRAGVSCQEVDERVEGLDRR
jgi:hypothetical protein